MPLNTTFKPNNPNIYSTIKSSVNCLKNNNVSGFHNIDIIQSKRQHLNLKRLLIKAEYEEVLWVCLTLVAKGVNAGTIS